MGIYSITDMMKVTILKNKYAQAFASDFVYPKQQWSIHTISDYSYFASNSHKEFNQVNVFVSFTSDLSYLFTINTKMSWGQSHKDNSCSSACENAKKGKKQEDDCQKTIKGKKNM